MTDHHAMLAGWCTAALLAFGVVLYATGSLLAALVCLVVWVTLIVIVTQS